MERLIKRLRNGRKVVFDQGRFDAWCVYIVERDGRKWAPSDIEYFSFFRTMAAKYSGKRVYEDFVEVYKHTSRDVDPKVIRLIDTIVQEYDAEDRNSLEQWLVVLYGGMIAEENKEGAVLKKRIKRLGMYQTLVRNMPPEQAANFSRGRKWQELDRLMKSFGF